jgi:hypothetical protein
VEEKSQLDEMRRSIGAARARVSASRSGLQSVAGDAPALRPAAPEPEPLPEPVFAADPAVEEVERPVPEPPEPVAVTDPEPERADDESVTTGPERAPATDASLLTRIRGRLRPARQR